MNRHDRALTHIRDIRRRIEEIRNTFYSTQRIHVQRPREQEKPSVDRTPEKENELDNLRKKLRGF